MVKLWAVTLTCLYCINGYSQRTENKNQLSINASNFIVLFNEQVNNLDLSYRYAIGAKYNLRSAINLDVTSSNAGITDIAVRLGIDRSFSSDGKWDFYYGCELNHSTNSIKSSNRINRNYGVYGFWGILYRIGDHFSLSTEPTLAFIYNTTRDTDDFGPQANSNWSELKLLNIGQLKLGFHF